MAVPWALPISKLEWLPRQSSDCGGFWSHGTMYRMPAGRPSARHVVSTKYHVEAHCFPTKGRHSVKCFAVEKKTGIASEQRDPATSDPDFGLDPVGFFKDRNLTSRAFPQYLRERYKALKDLRKLIAERDDNLLTFASAYEDMGLHRTPFHAVELIEWAPASRYCSVVGDFNNWEPSKEYAGEGYLGHDDNGCWRLVIEDKLREGEKPDRIVDEYSYDKDYDLGDENPDWDAIFNEADKQYWEPGEDEYMGDPMVKWLELHRKIFGDNPNPIYREESAGTEEEDDSEDYPDYIPSARARYEAWRASQPVTEGQLPPIDVIDDGRNVEPTCVDDPVYRARAEKKTPPPNYWKYLRSGRKAWEKKYIPTLGHSGRLRLFLQTPEGPLERIPAWATYVLQDVGSNTFSACMWDPPQQERHHWQHKSPKRPQPLRIYECHVGISGEALGVTNFREFTAKVLPHVKKSGYNAIQLMGIQEHVDYATAGYKVTNMFAVSSRFGTPEDFKHLVDSAHGMGLFVIMDIVHSYAAADEMVGLSSFDGANDCYFHDGRRGRHKHTGTRIFNYSEYEVLRYLLSNLKWWVEEYQIDGFHFHSLQSMFYTHNGFAEFTNGLNDYCNQYVDRDALLYVILANEMLHKLNPNIVTIAEDASQYPGLTEPISKGGLGFDYFASISPSKMWSYLIENIPDSEWSMSQIVETLIDSQSGGKALVYAENHVQSISEKRPIAEALLNPATTTLDRALLEERRVPLHKMIKLITFSLGGPAYLNFIGNEFGHTEWVDFPRLKNEFSSQYARRRWDLLLDISSFHAQLAKFDQALMRADEKEIILVNKPPSFYVLDDPTQVIIFSRGQLLFVFNFHPSASYDKLTIGVQETGEYERVLDTDMVEFGGQGRLTADRLRSTSDRVADSGASLTLSLPARSAQVYKLARIWES